MSIIRHEINLLGVTSWTGGDTNDRISLTPSNYSGSCTWYFEIVASVSSGSVNCLLHDSSQNTHATITITDTSPTLYREEFSSTPTDDNYHLNLPSSSAATVTMARVICIQNVGSSCTGSETQIEIAHYESLQNTTPTPLTYPNYFTYNSVNWDGTINVYFEAVLRANNAGATTYCKLQEDDGSWDNWADVTNGTLSSTGDTGPHLVRSSSAVTLTNGRHYRIVRYGGSASYYAYVYDAKLILIQSGTVTKMEEQYLVGNVRNSATGLQNKLTQYNSSEWTNGIVTFKYSHDAKSSAMEDITSKLTDITAEPDTDITNAIATEGNQEIVSNSFTMPDTGHIIDENVPYSTYLVCASRIICYVVLSSSQIISPSGVSFITNIGTITINTTYNLSLTGIDSTISIGVLDYYKILIQTLTGINSTISFGNILYSVGNVNLLLSGVNSSNSFGSITYIIEQFISITGIESSNTFGTVNIVSDQNLSLTGIDSTNSFGTFVSLVGVTYITPVEITPGTTGEWTDVDLSSYVPIGTTGVILHINNISNSNSYQVGYRCNGSTDARYGYIRLGYQLWVSCGIDENRVLELCNENSNYVDIYLVGYFDDCAIFNVNATNISISTTNDWIDIDLGVDDNAIGAFIEIYGGTGLYVGLRKNGSTDVRTQMYTYQLFGYVGLDGNEIFEGYISSTAVDFYLHGYIKSNATFLTNAKDISLTTTDEWIDLSGFPSNISGGFIETINNSTNTYYYGLRKDGSSEEYYRQIRHHNWSAVEANSGIIEGKINNTAVDFYLTGWSYSTKNASITWTGLTNSNSFGTKSFIIEQFISITGIESSNTFGTVNIVSDQNLSLTGIDNNETFGTINYSCGNVNLLLTGIDSGINIGTSIIYVDQLLSLTGINSGNSFGIPSLHAGLTVLKNSCVTWVTPVEITPSTTGSFTDVDVSSYCPAGTTGVILQVVVNTITGRNYFFRCNGSTDDRTSTAVNMTVNKIVFVGVDSNRIFEAYISSNANLKVYLCGYFNSSAVFNVNGTDISLSTEDSFVDVDINVNDMAIGAILEVVNTEGDLRRCSIRKNGSTDDINGDIIVGINSIGAIVGLDENEVFEAKLESLTIDFYLIGYVKSNVTFNTNATNLSLSSAGSYQDISLPDGSTGGFIDVKSSASYSYNLRKNGSSSDNYYDVWCHNWFAVECDESQLVEGKIENTSVDFYLVGYSIETITLKLSIIGINSTENIGNISFVKGNVNLQLTGISSSNTFGTPNFNITSLIITPTGIDSTINIGILVLDSNYNLVLIGISSTNIFGTPVSLTGNVNLSLVGIDSTLSIGNISFYGVGTLSLTGISSTITIGTINFGLGVINLIETGINSTLIIGTPLFSVGEIVLNLTSISSTSNFGTFSFNKGEVILSLSGINSTLSIGTPSLIIGLVLMGIPSSTTIGNIIFEKGNINLTLTGINSTAIISNLIFNSDLILTGINSTTTINSIIFQTQYNLLTNSIDSTLTIGNPILINLLQFLSLSSINSSLVFGNISLNLDLNVFGINSTVSIGTINFYSNINIPISSVVSTSNLGIISFVVGNVNLPLMGINSTTIIGDMKIIPLIKPSGINSTVTLGTPIITTTSNGITFIDAVEITPAVANTWTDVDLTGTILQGSKGVLLHVETTDTRLDWGARCNGSTDTRHQEQYYASHTGFAVGVDDNLVLELYVESITNVNVYIIGYFDSNSVFNVNATNISLLTTDVWTDININVGENLVGAIVEVVNNEYNTSHSFGLRKNGSSDNRYTYLLGKTIAFIGVDESNNCEGKISDTNIDFYLQGYIKSGCVFLTNATDLSLSTTDVYKDLPVLPNDACGGFIEYNYSGISVYNGALRKNGSSEDIYRAFTRHGWMAVECDANHIIEGKISNTNLDFFLTGYVSISSQQLHLTGIASTINFGHTTVSFPLVLTGLTNTSLFGTWSYLAGNTNLILSSILSTILFGDFSSFSSIMSTMYKCTIELVDRDIETSMEITGRKVTIIITDRDISYEIT